MSRAKLKFKKLMAWDTGNGLAICDADAADALIPNVAAFQSEIARLRPSIDLSGDDWDRKWEELKAYGALFATAPELVEECQTLIDVLERGTETEFDREEIIKYAKMVVARARGEA